jgi:amino acid adenylation domain-containing protein
MSHKVDHISTIRELIERRAQLQPDASFLIEAETGRVLTFRQLEQQSIVLSNQLREAGLERGDKIAFLMDNGLFTAQLFLGAMYGGFVVVPLNVRAGASQLSYTLDHCDAQVVYFNEDYRSLLNEVMASIPRPIRAIPAAVDAILVTSETSALVSELAPPEREDAALLMYTSGSTGHPKAAVHSHRTILAHGSNSIAAHELTSDDRSLLVLPLYHINAECVTLIPTLIAGGSVVIPRRFSVSQFWDWLDDYRCTWSAIVPTIISQLLDWQDPRAIERQAMFQRIRFIRSSSAPLAPSLHREFLNKFDILLIQAMGSSECGNVFSNPLPPRENKIGSAGLAWGFETRIINREGFDVSQGESGEMLIRGPGLMQGYYKQPEETAAAVDQDGWLHTGDLAYQDEDASFFVVGRSKELIIKGGVNIAPRQIDDVLESHPAVLEAAAVGVPDHYMGEDLVAFVVLRNGVVCDESELLTFCEGHLGHFKTPTRIYFADDLPKGPSGKVQRLRLRDDAVQAVISSSGSLGSEFSTAHANGALNGFQTSQSALEQIIAESWAEVLCRNHVDRENNFFALGGHSLLAVQCVSRLRERIPVPLSLSDFFEHATVVQQAALVMRRLRGAHPNSQRQIEGSAQNVAGAKTIPVRDRNLPCPLSPAQKRLWFMEQLNPDAHVYNESEGVSLVGELNVDAMERALNLIIARHEILRTTVELLDNEPIAIVHETWQLQIKKIDLSVLPTGERQAAVDLALTEEPRQPYNLETEPGIRATLLCLGPREHVLILMMHHIICDWSSEGVLWRELSNLYRMLSRSETPALQPLTIQHGDYAALQVRQNEETDFAEDLAFWKQNLRGAPQLLELPADRTRPAVQTHQGSRRRLVLNSNLTKALRDMSQRAETTPFTVFAAALNTLLYRYSGQEDILLGIPIADRDRKELQQVIGFLLHIQALRTELSADVTFRELLGRVQKGVLALFLHREVPFDQVVRKIQPERNPSYSPVFQVMLNWRDRDQMLSFIGLEGLVIESLLAESRTSKYDLTLFATDCGNEIWLEVEYSTDLFEESRIDRMLHHYQTLLESVAGDPDQTLSALPILTESEQQQLVVWNDTQVEYPADACVHELFSVQAKETPNAVAVVFNAEQLTYSELDEQSNRFAQYLHTLGVGPDVPVAVFVERSLELAVALLGILKAGGAYLPVDLALPQERVAFMLADAQPAVLVTLKELIGKLPPNESKIVCVDDFAVIEETQRTSPVKSANLAYVIYTSGSTGKPKGVQVSHRAVVNFLTSMRVSPGMTAQDTLLSVTTSSFDIFGLELWLPLTTGSKVVIAPQELGMEGGELAKLIDASGVTVMQATPSTWRILLESGWEGNQRLKILCGGEAWPEELATQLLSKCHSLWNMYGPTETTIWSAVYQVLPDKPILIGSPVANTQFYVVDRHLQLVPAGVPGELLIGGDGLAQGYLRRPELTAEKFIADPFSQNAHARLYRTGDLVRRLPNGNLEFLSRLDHQVKVRGFRIELGEIEAVLRQHPAVRQTAVVAREDTPGDKRLVAYLVANPEYQAGSVEAQPYSEHLDGWQTTWNEAYLQPGEILDPTFNIAGWNSSYTGEPIPAEEMRSWIDTTAERILSLRPQRVWEIGCGTGLVLHRVAPHCSHYFATDFSPSAIGSLQQQLAGTPLGDKVTLRQAGAHEFSGVEAESFDVVILNSVVQYFPHIDYLVSVLEGAVRAVKPGGVIFLGDIRSQALLKAFHTAVQLRRASPSLPCAELRRMIQRALAHETELNISPDCFSALRSHLPAITQVEIQLKRGHYRNELTQFRYDAILRVGQPPAPSADCIRLDWKQSGLTMSDLERYLMDERPVALALTDVPNARLEQERKALEILASADCPRTVDELRQVLDDDASAAGMDPEDCWTLGELLGYAVQVKWPASERMGTCDVVFVRQGRDSAENADHSLFNSLAASRPEKAPAPEKSWRAYANYPLQNVLASKLTPELSAHLKQHLPQYMVPTAFVLLPELPLTPNGKVDHKALPAPADAVRPEGTVRAAPQNKIEKKIAAIWQDVLGITKVGRDSNFFDLGGHSLQLVRVNTRLRQAFSKDIPVVDMFRFTTVRALASHLSADAESNAAATVGTAADARKTPPRRQRPVRRHLAN